MRLFTLCALLSCCVAGWSRAAEMPLVIPVWPGIPPGSEGKTEPEKVRVTEVEHEHIVSSVHRPSLTVYLPPADQATGAAVVICPGGGHRELWMDHEGYAVGRWLAEHGIAGFVLKYRLARETGSTYHVETHSLADAQRALKIVRSRAAEWGIDPARVGIIGFSAGGELAALTALHPAAARKEAVDPVDREDSTPSFQALIYPGNNGIIQPARGAPPAFLVCGAQDDPSIAEGTAKAYLRFREAGVSAELHIYAGAGHGFGIRESNHSPSSTWPDRFGEWLADRGFLTRTKS